MPRLNLNDTMKLRSDYEVLWKPIIEENLDVCPEVDVFHVNTFEGLSYPSASRTVRPSAKFTKMNQGTKPVKGQYESRLVQTYPILQNLEVDKRNATAQKLNEEMTGAFLGCKATIGRQMFYGDAADPDGFPGFPQLWEYWSKTLGKKDALAVNAGGTNGGSSSVWLVSLQQDAISLEFGGNTTLDLSPWEEGYAYDDEGGKFPAFLSSMTANSGIAVRSRHTLGRIYNLTEEKGKGLTDDIVADLIAKMKATPHFLFMTRKARRQLQRSRAIVRETGGNDVYAPIPEESNKVPIIVTDSLSDEEAIIAKDPWAK